jgi:IS5 family transposase
MAETIDWEAFDKAFTPLFCPDNGRPGIPTRMMVALHYLKYSENLSDEEVVEKWVQNPYWQYFRGGSKKPKNLPNGDNYDPTLEVLNNERKWII